CWTAPAAPAPRVKPIGRSRGFGPEGNRPIARGPTARAPAWSNSTARQAHDLLPDARSAQGDAGRRRGARRAVVAQEYRAAPLSRARPRAPLYARSRHRAALARERRERGATVAAPGDRHAAPLHRGRPPPHRE